MSEGKKLVPKLRFPEFLCAREWAPCRLKDVCEVNPASSPPPEHFIYIDLESVEAGRLTNRKACSRDEAPSRAQRVLWFGDVLFQIVRPYQRNNFHFKIADGFDYVASTGYAQLRAKESPEFLFQAIHVDDFVGNVVRKCTGSSYPAINSADLAEVPLAKPTLAEQEKVAECLGTLDQVIVAQAQRVAALTTQKNGLLQQLFPYGGEVEPRLRFPEFQYSGEWPETKAGSLFEQRSAKGEEGLPIYSVTIDSGMVKRESLDRKVDDIEEAAGNKRVCRNDIAYNMMRMWQGAMGVAPEDCLVSPAYVVLAPTKEAVPHFFQYFFKLPAMLQLLTSHSRGLTKDRLRLYFADFARMTFRCPMADEQQRIADFLRAVDDHIASEFEKLEALKAHQKGLMRQLFPSADALEA